MWVADNKLDALSIHGSCPVLKGQKTVLQQWLSTVWMAPVYSPGLQALWRQPSFDQRGPPGALDASGHKRALTADMSLLRGGDGAGAGAGAIGAGAICSARGLLSDSEESDQFSIAFLVAVEFCSTQSSLRLSLTASRKGAPKPSEWELLVENCEVRLTVPGSSEGLPLRASIEKNQWVHVSLLTEDLGFDPISPNRSATFEFRSHLIVQGKSGAQSVRGAVKRERSEGAKRKVCVCVCVCVCVYACVLCVCAQFCVVAYLCHERNRRRCEARACGCILAYLCLSVSICACSCVFVILPRYARKVQVTATGVFPRVSFFHACTRARTRTRTGFAELRHAHTQGSLNWSAARLCLWNRSPDHADFAQVCGSVK